MGELARFDGNSSDEAQIYHTSEGDLTYDEWQNLADFARFHPTEIDEQTAMDAEAHLSREERRLKWGAYLVDHLIVSDWFDAEGRNVLPPEPNE